MLFFGSIWKKCYSQSVLYNIGALPCLQLWNFSVCIFFSFVLDSPPLSLSLAYIWPFNYSSICLILWNNFLYATFLNCFSYSLTLYIHPLLSNTYLLFLTQFFITSLSLFSLFFFCLVSFFHFIKLLIFFHSFLFHFLRFLS